jgi:hypothetical protein
MLRLADTKGVISSVSRGRTGSLPEQHARAGSPREAVDDRSILSGDGGDGPAR